MIDWNEILLTAADSGNLLEVENALKHGADIEATSNRSTGKDTPLIRSARSGHLKCVQFLIKKQANIEAETSGGATPLMLAAFTGHDECVQYLIDAKADIYATDNQGDTILMFTAYTNRINALKIILKADPELISIKNHIGKTALNIAIVTSSTDCIKFLILSDADTTRLETAFKEKYALYIKTAQKNKKDRKKQFHEKAQNKIHQDNLKTLQKRTDKSPIPLLKKRYPKNKG